MLTVRKLIDVFFANHEPLVTAGLLRPATVAGHRYQLKKIPAPAARLPAVELGLVHLSGVSLTRHFLQSLQRLYNWAHQTRLIPANPIGRVPMPSSGQRERTVDDWEWKQIFRAAPRPFRWFLLFQRETLMRPGEVRELRWRDVDLRTRMMKLRDFKAKNRRRDKLRTRLVPLSHVAGCLLAKMRAEAGNPHGDQFVFLSRRGTQLSSQAVRLAMHRACERAGIDQRGERIVAYTIRHTAATEATRHGLDGRPLADIMGHTDTRTTARYQHLDGRDLVDALDRANARKAQSDPRSAGRRAG